MKDSAQDHIVHKGNEQPTGESKSQGQVEWTSNPQTVEAKQDTDILIDIKDISGKVIEVFSAMHEKELHLLAIKKDLSVFQYPHPQLCWEGQI
jgi:hypothetical protein